MDEKTLETLEFHKVLERLAGYCAFSASAEEARAMRPTPHLAEARRRQAETVEARELLAVRPETTIGGARDVRSLADAAARDAVLTPGELLEVKATLISARTLARTFERLGEGFAHLGAIAAQFPRPPGLVDAVSQAISDRGEILDGASGELSRIRSELRVAHDRLLTRMQRLVNDPDVSPYLQDNLVTQRDGRYVLPLRAEFKGRVKAIIHDQSSSGATLFIEPLGVVDLNNRYRELQLDERDEEYRVLAGLSHRVGEYAAQIQATVEVLVDLDLAFARAKFAEDLDATEPALQSFRRNAAEPHPGSVIQLWQARHPLLDPQAVVPIDVELAAENYALVITGPNTGGKTVTLKTVGLLVLMAQSGLHVPAQAGCVLSVFQDVYADIGDEQSIEQSLSTFSGHITNIIRILERAGRQYLVILDELGAGTDPQEGSALARAILAALLERGATTLVATHYPELKAYAHATPGVANASVEFDLETLSPTYRLSIGLPGRSNALAIAERLGLPPAIITAARAVISPADLRAEDLLDEIHRQRNLAREARSAAETARQETESLRARLSGRLEAIEEERRAVLQAARQEAAHELEELEVEIRQVRQALRRARQPLDDLEPAEAAAAELEDRIQESIERDAPDLLEPEPRRPVRPGDRVRLRSLGAEGVLSSLGEDEAEVQVGNLRVRARRADLEWVGEGHDRTPEAQATAGGPLHQEETDPVLSSVAAQGVSPGMELDLRGFRVDEALLAVDRYLDSAYLAGLPYVRIIHGKGTGRLRAAVRQELARHPQVASYENGLPNEGGDGVTVARLIHS